MANFSRYRDSDTGRFVSESTYSRSVSHGGTRYHAEIASGETGKTISTVPTEGEEEFIDFESDDFFDSGYEADEEDEY